MSRVLLVGESWFVYSIHQKGFDAFSTSEYSEGGTEFITVLERAGHSVDYIPSHEIHARFPATAGALAAVADVVVISDVGANSFQLSPDTFVKSRQTPDKTEVVREFVASGGGVLRVGGYLTFTGIDAKARWGVVPLADALPVRLLERDDRVELPAGEAPQVVAEHPIVRGLDSVWPALLGLNEITAKAGSEVIAECGGHPLLVVGDYGAGRSAAFTSDVAPHWAPEAFVQWAGYQRLFDRTVSWLAGGDLS